MKKNPITLKNRPFAYPLAALLAGTALFAFLFAAARYGVPSVDEADYCNLRLLQGDIPFVEWWDPMQLFWFTQMPAVGLYMKLAGSAEGLLLFMRYLFLLQDALMYALLCRRLRGYGAAGVAASLFFCAAAPQTLISVSYFSLSSFSFTAACAVLCLGREKPRALFLVFIGALAAAGIMAEPFVIIIYIIYMAAVLARRLLKNKKDLFFRFAFALEFRAALLITLGAFLVFAALMAFLSAKGSFSRLGEMLPYIFGGVKYNGASLLDPTGLLQALQFYGPVPAAGFGLLLAAAIAVYFRRGSRRVRLALFAVSCALAAACWGSIVYGVFISKEKDIVLYINYFALLTLICAFLWFFLCEKHDPRMLALCAASALYSLAVDTASSSLLGTGGWLAVIPGTVCFFSLAGETAAALKEKGNKPLRAVSAAAALCAALCAVSFCGWEGGYLSLETVNTPIEHYIAAAFDPSGEAYAAQLSAGPFKGIVTTRKIADVYAGALADLDQIKAEAEGGPVMVYGFTPFAYLYLDLPYGTQGAWYDGDLDRTLAYWETFPERKPRFIYFPLFDNLYWVTPRDFVSAAKREALANEIRTQLSVLGEFEVVYGKSGVLLKVLP